MPNRELPAIDWLGYSLDLSRSPTIDVRAVASTVLRGRRLITIDIDENLREVEINGIIYDVPRAVRISQATTYQGNFVTFPTGNDAQLAFHQDAGLPSRYFAVTGTDISLVLAWDRSFIRENQYAFFSFTNTAYAARLSDYADLLNERALLLGVEELPLNFDGNNEYILGEYKSFFQRYGSHVIVNVNYGARFQLNAWASNANSAVNAKFATDVVAYFDGIPSGGQYDASVKSEAQYKTFLGYVQKLLTVLGGEAQYASPLPSDPNWATYSLWSSSVEGSEPIHTSFHTMALWTLMAAFPNDTLKRYAGELDKAFTWILTHARVYKTAVIFDIQSDWAEFNLLSPSAIILADEEYPFPLDTVASTTRVQWGKEQSHVYRRQTLRFFIINDGSPIDFSISHGSDGAAPRQGRADALIEREQYINDRITDNVWNTLWFFNAPVSLSPVTRKTKREDKGIYTWDVVLHDYLREIGAVEGV